MARLSISGEQGRKSSVAGRRNRAAQSFASAAECIGPIEREMSLFAITRGQWSMIDAVLHTLDCVGRARLSLWTWTVAEYEVEVLDRLRRDDRLESGLLVIDYAARAKNLGIIRDWKAAFGGDSVRYVVNHAKIATVEGGGYRCLLRGSMNLNFNPRFEQFDLTEGGADFDLVREIEGELPILGDHCSGDAVYRASKVSSAFEPEQLELFKGIKVWAK